MTGINLDPSACACVGQILAAELYNFPLYYWWCHNRENSSCVLQSKKCCRLSQACCFIKDHVKSQRVQLKIAGKGLTDVIVKDPYLAASILEYWHYHHG